jgi:transcription initiation factor TFIIB
MCGNMRAALLQHKTLQGPSLTKINKTAEQLLQRLLEAKRTKGRPRAVLQAATLYAACRINGFPVTLDMLAEQFNISRKDLARAYRMMTYEFKLRPKMDSPEDYVVRYAARFGKRNVGRALNILARAREAKIHLGKKPACLAAAALYLASGGQLLQKDLAKFFGISGLGIRLSAEVLQPFIDNGGP